MGAKDEKLKSQGAKDRRVSAVAAKAAKKVAQKVADKVTGKGTTQQATTSTNTNSGTSLTKPDLSTIGTNYHPAIALNGLPQLNPSAHKGILRNGKGVFRDGLNTKTIATPETVKPDVSKTAFPKHLIGEYSCFNPACAHTTQTYFDTTVNKKPRYTCDKCEKKAVISKFKKIS